MNNSRIILIGPMGAGKSSVALRIAQVLHKQCIDSDVLLAQKLQKGVAEIMSQHGEQYFRQQERLLLEELITRTNIVLATGGGSILDAALRDKLRNCGLICYLKVSPEQQVMRVQQCCHRPSVPTDLHLRKEFFVKMALQRNLLYETIAAIHIDTAQLDIDSVAARVMQHANS